MKVDKIRLKFLKELHNHSIFRYEVFFVENLLNNNNKKLSQYMVLKILLSVNST